MWDDILGHEQNKEFLTRLLQPGNRPHALLFYGPEGIGCVLPKLFCAGSRTSIPAAGASPAA